MHVYALDAINMLPELNPTKHSCSIISCKRITKSVASWNWRKIRLSTIRGINLCTTLRRGAELWQWLKLLNLERPGLNRPVGEVPRGVWGHAPTEKFQKNCLFKLGSSRKIDQQKCTNINSHHINITTFKHKYYNFQSMNREKFK